MNSQKGFALNTALLIALLIAVLGFSGYFVYSQNKKEDPSSESVSQDTTKTTDNQSDNTESAPMTTDYTFEELGIKMALLDGWTVTTSHKVDDYGNAYRWDITKPDADGKIVVESKGFVGGWVSDCSEYGGSTPTTVIIDDIAPTKNPKLVFMNWTESDGTSNEASANTGIALGTNKSYAASKDPSSPEIPTSDLKVGTYYRCESGPGPGMFLDLSKEVSANSARNDTIRAIKYGSDAEAYSSGAALPSSAASYADIRAILVSVQ